MARRWAIIVEATKTSKWPTLTTRHELIIFVTRVYTCVPIPVLDYSSREVKYNKIPLLRHFSGACYPPVLEYTHVYSSRYACMSLMVYVVWCNAMSVNGNVMCARIGVPGWSGKVVVNQLLARRVHRV